MSFQRDIEQRISIREGFDCLKGKRRTIMAQYKRSMMLLKLKMVVGKQFEFSAGTSDIKK